MELYYIHHSFQVLLVLGNSKVKQETVITDVFITYHYVTSICTAPLKTVLTSCSVSATDLQSIQELICYYRSDLAQALIRHERSLQVTLHQIKLIGKEKCASENLQVSILFHCSPMTTECFPCRKLHQKCVHLYRKKLDYM